MINKMVEKDERTTFIENISYRFGYIFITFALLLDVAYRSLKLNEAPWDLLGIIIISGFFMSIYQYKQRILGKAWLRIFVLTFTIALIIATLFLLLHRSF